ncbi:MAG: phosphohydrolase [Nitrospirae bacterium CG_4_10_14_3_um_filter_44_29]|nr:MAG: phosphohydrolase [Nitrospirae bacterium CG_4_10_14_3_um_filter_44_29]
MSICDHAPILDAILESWRTPLGKDYTSYRNHCYRVLNFSLAFCGESTETISKVSIAVAFHDLGIWANNTYDYLGPSKQLAREYLSKTDQVAWNDEIEAMIEQHHKLGKYKANPNWLVESFRKADWIDVSRGKLKFGLPSAFVVEIISMFPNAGFHKRLIALTKERLKTHPFSPLPMMRL